MFEPLGQLSEFAQKEEHIAQLWMERDIYHKSVSHRNRKPYYVFYEGPPTTNGLPHAGHIIGRSMKDLIPRYKTMCGYCVPRKAGWDTHGLPVELEVEKELGFSGKNDIERFGIEAFNEHCRRSVEKYIAEWERLSIRMGIWMDYDDPYITCTNQYIESTWWILKNLWEKELLYQGFKVLPYCARCGTSLSSHEVALGYRETDDPSIYVKFALRGREGVFFLVWTTTPWTLAANVALAVGEDLDYVEVEEHSTGERLILNRERYFTLFDQNAFSIVSEYKGRELKGLSYHRIMEFARADRSYKVYGADFVSTEEGTGIVHIAPAYGEDDMKLAVEMDLPVLTPVRSDGTYGEEVVPWAGRWVKDADPDIIDWLSQAGIVFRREIHRHTYPYCWRCDTPLLYYAKESWFVRSTAIKEILLQNNRKIHWHPEHIREGRFGYFLENVVDWALSRERYWGTPLNIWECGNCHRRQAVGSVKELEELAGENLSDMDLHRPYVDRVEFACSVCEGNMKRVKEVIDCWFDSGAMFVSQLHYPFENKELFKKFFPADFICEAIDQTRGWFYSLHILGSCLFEVPTFKNCLVTELGLDEKGQKMSKHIGNVVSPWELIEEYGADVLRWYVFSVSPPWVSKRFGSRPLADVFSKFFTTLWNTYNFFALYANIDEYNPSSEISPLERRNDLDRWIVSRFEELVKKTRQYLDGFEISKAAKEIEYFLVEDLSNWYIRRSRRRFWKSGMDKDKTGAYATLYGVLEGLSRLLAPFIPFVAEALYANLSLCRENAKESVHLEDYPEYNPGIVDKDLLTSMDVARRLTILGRSVRNRVNVKTRQPLRRAVLVVPERQELEKAKRFDAVIREELNIKEAEWTSTLPAGVSVSLKPVFSVLGPRLGKMVKEVSRLLSKVNQEESMRFLEKGELELTVGEELVLLGREDLEVTLQADKGFSVESSEGYAVVLDTELDQDLMREGMARELVHMIQVLRKEAGFEVEDRIKIILATENNGELRQLVEEYEDFIRSETLADQISLGCPPSGEFTKECQINGEKIFMTLER